MQRLLKLKVDSVLVVLTRRNRTNELFPNDDNDNTERSNDVTEDVKTPRALYISCSIQGRF